MKKILLVLTLSVLFLVGCVSSGENGTGENGEQGNGASGGNGVQPSSPVDELSAALVEQINADFTDFETDEEIADSILSWEENNLFWCNKDPEASTLEDMFIEGYLDCSVDMQFNQMLAGSFPVSKVLQIKVRNGKTFGQCYTYATVYCAIARWNGLECRVMVAKKEGQHYGGDWGTNYCGVAPKTYVEQLGLNCNEWKTKTWHMNTKHYWAEVLIDGEWKVMEKPLWSYGGNTGEHIKQQEDYENTDW